MKKKPGGKKPAKKNRKNNAAKPKGRAPAKKRESAPSPASHDADDEFYEAQDPTKRVKKARRPAKLPREDAAPASRAKPEPHEKKPKPSPAEKKARRTREEDELDTSYIPEARGISHEERRRRQTLHDLLRIGVIVLVICAVAAGLFFAFRATIVRHISVTGSNVYGEAQILSMSGVRPGKSIFFYSEKQIKDDINSIPDLRVVSVKKAYPNDIGVVVADITAYAAILSPNGVYTLISDDGYVLSMGESSDHGLITIEGMTGIGFALNTYIDKQNNTIRTVGAVRLLQAIESSPLAPHVRSIDLSSSQYVTLTCDGDYSIVLGAISTAPECVETACTAYERFLPVYPGGGTIQVFRGSSVVDFTPNK